MRFFRRSFPCPFLRFSVCPLGYNEFCYIFARANLKLYKIMAVLTKHVLGVPSGSLADSISFSSWRGKACIKSLPTSVNDPQTDAQLDVRARFALLGETLVSLSDVINLGWKGYERSGRKARTAQNAYMSYHMKQVDPAVLFNGTSPDYTSLNPDKLLISRGSLSGATQTSYMADKVTLEFPDDVASDLTAVVVFFNPDANESVYATSEVKAGEITISLAPMSSWEGVNYLYSFVIAENGKKASNSEVSAY